MNIGTAMAPSGNLPITIVNPGEGTFVMTMSAYATHPTQTCWVRLPGAPPSLDWQDDEFDSDKAFMNITA